MKCKALLFLTVLGSSISSTAQTEYYVAPNGSDTNPGTVTQPFASLDRARNALRQSRAPGPKTVSLRRGTYYLPQTFVLRQRDSGTVDAPITYRAYPGEEVIISGGTALSLKWQAYRQGILQAQTPAGLEIDQLFVNGKRRHMARYPNYDPEARPYNGAAADAFSPERAARWADPTGGYIHAMHRAHWGGYHYRITGKKENNEVTYEGGWQNNRQMGMHKNDRFVENIFEELDAPGEWFHDAKNNVLYYWPDADVDVNSARFEVVRLTHLIELRGLRHDPVQHISLDGFTFRHAARTFMQTKEPLLRSDWTIYRGGAVLFNDAHDCAVSRCQFDQLGGNAIFANNHNRRITIRACHIHGSGASGICFVGSPEAVRNPLFEYRETQSYQDIDKTPGPRSDNYPADCLVEDCLIHNISVVEKQATGVQISMAKSITIRHCSIYDVGRAGINISEGTFGGHLIEFCDVFDTVRETGDHGSFNSWGRDRFWHLQDAPESELPALALLDAQKTIIRNSRWRCDHGWDIDLDDGSSSYHVYNNLCLNGGIKFREGFHRVCENNIMVNNSFHPHVWYKHSQDVFCKNIVFTPYRPIRVPTPWGKQCDLNLLHTPGMSGTAPATELQKQSTLDKSSIRADALFLDPAQGDYRVGPNSPALKLGFKNFPMDQFGVQSPKLKAIARTPLLPEIRSAPQKVVSDAASFWQGATVKQLTGEAFSAFGVSKAQGGVHLLKVPAGSLAAGAGLQTGDLVQSINGVSTKTVADLQRACDQAQGKDLDVSYVRSQETHSTSMKAYIYVKTESTDAQFKRLPLLPSDKLVKIEAISTEPGTVNQAVNVLSDGKLAQSYGPVFPNQVVGGTYQIDLGRNVTVAQVRSFSFNQNNNRAHQRFTLLGISEKQTRETVALATVDTTTQPVGKYLASSVQVSDGTALGSFRWITWVLQPVTSLQENTAFQEFQVVP